MNATPTATQLDLAGQRILVTGASSGIGAGLAERFAARGATVGLTARREDRLAEVLERCRRHAPDSRMWVRDLADAAQVDDLGRAAIAELGGVDGLVNNAGIPKRRSATALDMTTVEHVMAVNYLAPVRLTLALLPAMLERGEGRIVCVSSIAARLSPPGEAAYSASKAALTAFMEGLAADIWGTGVRTLVVYPGVVDTELFHMPDNDPPPDGLEAITVEELVDGVEAALAEDRLEVTIPSDFAELAKARAQDVPAFIEGAAAWSRQQTRT